MNTNCKCGGKYELFHGVTEEGVHYESYKCNKCSDEILNWGQAEALAMAMEKIYSTTVSKWGEALAIRIPAEVVKNLHLKAKQKARIIPEKKAFRVVPA